MVNHDPESHSSKKRRLPGACDLCKKKKVRCDSGGVAGQRCTNCLNSGAECTHVELTKNLGSAKGYVEGLEQRLEKMQTLLKKLLPGVDNFEDLEDALELPSDEIEIPRNDENFMTLGAQLERMKLDPNTKRFFGRSSGLYLIETALHHKHHILGESSSQFTANVKRDVIWDPPAWQLRCLEYPQPQYDFPPLDLMVHVLDLYFEHVNSIFPVFHRPTFESSIAEGVHLRDTYFGGTVLLACALGSRYSNDPRVFSEGPTVQSSAGWQWYIQVPIIRTNLQISAKPTLHEIQCYALAVIYIKATTVSQSTWTQIGFGLRLAQDVGAHRRRNLAHPTIIDELWKRAFFVLLTHERAIGSFSGRPATIHEEEYDVDFPLDCDDEYFEHPDPSMDFKQPAGIPSKMSFFVHYMKLMDILAYAMRAIYPIRKPTTLTGRPKAAQSMQQLISELDSALNQWLEAVPEHLKWDPNRRGIFFQQSCMLYCVPFYSNYYNMQIFIHRPFIPMPHNPTSLTLPSLAICATAARACGHVARAMVLQDAVLPYSHSHICFFSTAVVLLLSTWTGRRTGVASNTDAMGGVEACMQTFKMCEARWPSAGRLWDMINDMLMVGDLIPTHNNKRSRNSEEPLAEAPNSPAIEGPRPVAGSVRALHAARNPINGPHNFTERRNEVSSSGSSDSPASSGSISISTSPPSTLVASPESLFPSVNYVSNTVDALNFVPDVPANDVMSNTTSSFMPDTSLSTAEVDFDSFLASLPSMDSATVSMWSQTPTGYEPDDWRVYLSNLQGTGILDSIRDVNLSSW